MQSEDFKLSHIRRSTLQSREIGPGPAKSQPGPISSASAVCLHCGESWMATTGNGWGQLEPTIGGMKITCPKCHRASVVTNAEISEG
jgi:hypothetical protein